MSQKNKASVVILSLMMTIAIVGTGIWWFASRSGRNVPTPPPPIRTLPNAPTPKPRSSIDISGNINSEATGIDIILIPMLRDLI